ncbi:MAG: HAD family phosphatase [Comamonadaceae bacterium]|nr:HAD family phosphatase [Comamonadaceae bacterium]
MNVVFDFGAVLVTWQPGQFLLQMFPERVATLEAARHLAHQVFGHPDWHEFDRGGLAAEQVVSRISQRLDLPLPAVHQLVYGIRERLTPIDGTVAVLKKLHTLRQASDRVTGLYYLSNMPHIYARHLEAHHEFVQWFDGGVFSADVQHIKPDPAIYQLLQSRYALQPDRTLFIDDLKTNVHVAQTLGWQGLHFESPEQLQADLALLGL